MKFGLESEKFIFDLNLRRPSKGVFSFIDALSDYEPYLGGEAIQRVTNEFVLNLIEIGTAPSVSPIDVLKDYLFNLLLLQSVALREGVALVPMGAMPMDYQPHMLPKWPYFVQNSILDKKKQDAWTMGKSSPLRAAGNCAGVHVHAEIETPLEFLFSNRELMDKFNLGLMLTPMIAFSSSPYFFGKHEAVSMRGRRYFEGVYRNEPLNGGIPGMMASSQDVLLNVQRSVENWIQRGVKLGFSAEDMQRLTSKKGANWNPIRWNRQWNTIELRCLDSDRIDLDAAKFIWVCRAMRRMDLKGEALQTQQIQSAKSLDAKMVEECFAVSGGRVSVLGTPQMQDLFARAVSGGTKDPLVERFLHRLHSFAKGGDDFENRWAFQILKRVLDSHSTTAEKLLQKTRRARKVTDEKAVDLVIYAVEEQKKVVALIRKVLPEVFADLEKANPDFNYPD